MKMVNERLKRSEWIESVLVRYEKPLLRCAIRIVGDVEIARDVVQDTFLRLCKADREQVEGHIAAWLFTVCKNRSLDVVRKEGRMGHLDNADTVVDDNASNRPEDLAGQKEVHQIVLEVINSLPEQQQEAFRLKFNDELTYREISQVMGKSLGTVSKLLSTALGTVRERLRARVELAQEG